MTLYHGLFFSSCALETAGDLWFPSIFLARAFFIRFHLVSFCANFDLSNLKQ